MKGSVMAWHFVGATLRNGSPIPPDGTWLKFPGKLILCKAGFHASKEVWDALQYAPGSTLCRVACRGDILHQSDKLVCSERMIISRMDTTHILRLFARRQALSVIHLWNAPPIVKEYLETGEESKRDAAWAAARAATRAAERAAARDAARNVAWAAAWAAVWDATRDVTWDAARLKQQEDFTKLVQERFGI